MKSIEGIWNDHMAQREERERNSFYVTDLSRCLRGVYLERMGEKPEHDDRTLRVFEVGNLFEEKIVEAVGKQYPILTQGSVVWPEYDLRGRYDILIDDAGEKKLVELKTMHSQGFYWRAKTGFQPLPHHKEQVMLYFGKLKEEYPNLTASVCYISKDDLCIREIPVLWDEGIYNVAIVKAKVLKEAWDKREPPLPADAVVFDEAKKKWVVNWQASYCSMHEKCTGNPNWLAEATQEAKLKNKKT